MKTALLIYGRAQLFYALLTLPALFVPVFYLFSEGFALVFGLAGLALFLPVLPLLRAASVMNRRTAVALVLVAGLAAALFAVWLACGSVDNGRAFSTMREWWPFPAAALVATAVAVLWTQEAIHKTVSEVAEPQVISGYGAPL